MVLESRKPSWPTARFVLVLLVGLFAGASAARAELIQVPIGSRAVSLGEGRVACEADLGGWNIDLHGRLAKPPSEESAIGQSIDLHVAANATACADGDNRVTLVATDRYPVVDLSTVVFSPDEGRIDAEGARL
ncbi:MAG: hypothetical protein RLZZ450_6590, partial [Pseudomonadota bacterium]